MHGGRAFEAGGGAGKEPKEPRAYNLLSKQQPVISPEEQVQLKAFLSRARLFGIAVL